jgi:hypothetical protein
MAGLAIAVRRCAARQEAQLRREIETMSPTTGARPGRNEPCHCGSGRKYKQCCLDKDEAKARKAYQRAMAAAPPPAATGEAASRPPPKPRPQTQQPWKRAAASRHGFQRISTPRKVGG